MRIFTKNPILTPPRWAKKSTLHSYRQRKIVPAENRPAVRTLLRHLHHNLAKSHLLKPIVDHSRCGPTIDPALYSCIGFTPFLLENGLGISLVPHLLRPSDATDVQKPIAKTIEFRLSKLHPYLAARKIDFYAAFWSGVSSCDQSEFALAFAETFAQTLEGSLSPAPDQFRTHIDIKREQQRFTQADAVVSAFYQGRPQIFLESESAGLVIHYC